MRQLLSQDPLYKQYAGLPDADVRPLGGSPKTGPIPRSNTPVDVRSLGYACATTLADMHIARREGENEPGRRSPAEQPHKEEA